MIPTERWTERIDTTAVDSLLGEIYGKLDVSEKKGRIRRILDEFDSRRSVAVFSTPGRTELGGNHTDHNHGRVLAGGIHLDSIGVAAPREDMKVSLVSEGYDHPFEVDLEDLVVRPEERETTESLIRGIASRLTQLGKRIGGFDARMTSNVLPGSGLSSSASVEVLIGTIFNHLYNDDSVSPVEIAKIGQFAENNYFGKPCGLMDQTACAVGGIMSIDFRDPGAPVVEEVAYDFADAGYALMVVDTGGNHADLTPEYAAVPEEMRRVAAHFGKETCRELTAEMLLSDVPGIRTAAGDRALLRALHFLNDNERVPRQIEALRRNDIAGYLALVNESGDSSWRLLQNCVSVQNPSQQGITVALALTSRFLRGEGAARVHGGGFAGTIQAYIPLERETEYVARMEQVFGTGCCTRLRIRPHGTIALPDEG
jgi:galactokinase